MTGDHNMKPCARDDIIRMAQQAGAERNSDFPDWSFEDDQLERFAALVAAAEREKVAAWMMERGYATGHGGTIEDLLKELEWQIREQEREACAYRANIALLGADRNLANRINHAIRKG